MYFIIKTGYGATDHLLIDNLRDLEKAQYAFLTNSKTIFETGEVCRGQDIISIKEDWHREMGWNKSFHDGERIKTYELGPEDWTEIRQKGIEKKYKGVLAEIKNKVVYLMENNKTNLIGKGIEIALPEKSKEISAQASLLAEKMKV